MDDKLGGRDAPTLGELVELDIAGSAPGAKQEGKTSKKDQGRLTVNASAVDTEYLPFST